MKKLVCGGIGLAVLAALALATSSSGALQEKPKYTIKDVMQEAHKGGLLKKVTSGKATKEEKEKLVQLYAALHLNTPPRGDAKAFKVKTETMLKLAKGVLADDKDALTNLAKEVNCKNCHDTFK